MSVRGGALDIKLEDSVTRINIKKREYHHIFPKSKHENSDRALNCILISEESNRFISDKSPDKYLADSSIVCALGEEQIRKRLHSHFVDYDLLIQGDFQKFLEKRAEHVVGVINELCDGKDWRP